MRKFLILAATAASALAVATPAAAQWYPPQYNNYPPQYGYGGGYGGYNAYGNIQYRIDRLQTHIAQFDRANVISNREARILRAAAYDLERQLRYGGDGYGVERRLAQLEQRVDYIASRTRYGRYNYNNHNQWNGHNNWNHNDRNWRDHDDDDDDD